METGISKWLTTEACRFSGRSEARGMTPANLSDSIGFWRWATGALATLSLAFLVAAVVAHDPADFSRMAGIAVLRDGEQRPIWAIRLARTAHQIAADSLRAQTIPLDHAYQLWLVAPNQAGPHQLGLLPPSGRKRIPVSPEAAQLLTGAGELMVTLEPAGGSPSATPSGPVVFRGTLEGAS